MNRSKVPTLDLHAFRVEEVASAVDRFIYQNHHLHRVRIMTGKGTGQVRKAVTTYLKQGDYDWHFEDLPNGGQNQGVLVVELR